MPAQPTPLLDEADLLRRLREGFDPFSKKKPPPEIAELFDQLRARAAVLGTFAPRQLVQSLPNVSEAHVAPLLTFLADECDEVDMGGCYHWRLRPDERRNELAALSRAGRLREVAEQSIPDEQDLFGQQMKIAVLSTPVDMERLPMDALGRLYTALQFITPLMATSLTVAEVNAVLARRSGYPCPT